MPRVTSQKMIVPVFMALIIFGGLIWAVWRAERPLELHRRSALPELTLVDIDGNAVTTASWKGPYIINIFASWCVPCKAELPELQYYAQYLPVYGIAWQDQPAKLESWLAEHKPPFTAVAMDNGMELMQKLRIGGVPVTMVVTEDGRIAHAHEGALKPQYRKILMRAIMDNL